MRGCELCTEPIRNTKRGRTAMKMKDIPTVAKEYDFILALCAFLDKFKVSEDKPNMILEEPIGGILKKSEYSILACVTHKLANDTSIEVPKWVYNERYYMKKPIYAFGTKNKEFQEFLKKTSLEEFKQRNVYYGENAMSRV